MESIRKLFEKPVDLTYGSIWKKLLLISIPTFLSLVFQQIYSISDAAIVGNTLSSEEFAGINNSSSLIFIILQFAFGCTSGFSVITARMYGKKDMSMVRKSIFAQLILAFLISLVLTIVGIASLKPLLNLLNIYDSATDITSRKVYEATYTFVFITYLSIFSQMYYNMAVSVLRAMGDTFTPLLFLIASTFLNIGLEFLFILVFKMGVAGSGIATFIAQTIAAIACFIYMFSRYKELRIKKEEMKVPFSFYLEHLKNGLPLGFQFSITGIGIIIMQKNLILFDYYPDGVTMVEGTPAEVGAGAAYKFGNILMDPYNALGTSILAFMGQNHGAKDYKRIKRGFTEGFILGTSIRLVMMSFGLLMTIDGAYLRIFLSADKINAETIRFGNLYLYLACPTYFILMCLFLMRNSLQGLQKSLFPFLAGVGELAARTLICTYLRLSSTAER